MRILAGVLKTPWKMPAPQIYSATELQLPHCCMVYNVLCPYFSTAEEKIVYYIKQHSFPVNAFNAYIITINEHLLYLMRF